ncbi:MAG: hypothetical protein KF900_00040 [Bacteroidetes bacterium]|nr:hypothetical protein [Bacteroidota bacterium]
MKKVILILFAVTITAVANAQQVNEKVQVEHNGSWYDAKILEVKNDRYYIKYEGWSDSWNEWVTQERLRNFKPEAPESALTKFKVGDRVEVEYGMIPEPATVIEVGENKYHIKYDKKAFGDKWVSERQIKKL